MFTAPQEQSRQFWRVWERPGDFDRIDFKLLAGVADVVRISSPYKLAGRGFRPEGTIVRFPNGVAVGGDEVVVMAGPCSVESREQIFTVAEQVKSAGASCLGGRGIQTTKFSLFLPGNGS